MTPAVWPDYLEMDPMEEPSSPPRFGQWSSISRWHPADDQMVLCYYDDGFMAVATYLSGGFVSDSDEYALKPVRVTHWMPLPEPPKMEKKHE